MNSVPQSTQSKRPTLGVVIRFHNSAATLPEVFAALQQQSVQPDLILGVDHQSTDASAAILREAGAEVVTWTKPYHHAQVLNFALEHCGTDLFLILSSHTVLKSPDALARMVAALEDPRTACVSAKWDRDPFYTDALDWNELKSKGLKFGSIYTNSMGLIRRSFWEETRFDESLLTMEDGAWALEQLKRGRICRRLELPFSYQRRGRARDFAFAAITFRLAAQHGLRVAWLGPWASLKTLLQTTLKSVFQREAQEVSSNTAVAQRLLAWFSWRFAQVNRE